MHKLYSLATGLALLVYGNSAQAVTGQGVGLGVAGGLNFSPTKIQQGTLERDAGQSFAWGFFVDIPLLSTFYIAPAAMIYELNLDGTRKPVTDIDINFKFIVPIDSLRLGAGATMGITSVGTSEDKYSGHYGFLGYLAYALVPNLEVFALGQYKKIARDLQSVDNIQGFGGVMFRF